MAKTAAKLPTGFFYARRGDWRSDIIDRRAKSKTTGPLKDRFGPQTSNHWLKSARAFVNFLIRRELLTKNPFNEIKLANVALDVRRERTILTDDETQKLFVFLTKPLTRKGSAKRVRPTSRATARSR